MDKTELMLKELTEASGVPGYEGDVRAVIRKYVQGFATIEEDRLGSIICRKAGTCDRPRVMLAGHMDEIGFMVRQITKEGCVRFVPLGGWWDQVMLAQRVVIKTHKGDVLGVFGVKAPHLIPVEDRKKMIEKKDMYIDVGVTNADEARDLGLRPGDPIIPISPFEVLAGGKTYMGKAWDDRIGCAVFIDVIERLTREPHPNAVYGVGTVQEEVGLRGAKTSAYVIDPDVSIVLESDIPGDVPGITEAESTVKLGKGPSLCLYERGTIPTPRFRDLAVQVAEDNGIPIQFSSLEGGSTDGAMIHLNKAGVPTIIIGVPARHIHSHSGILRRDDYDNAVRWVMALIRRLDSKTVADLTR